MRVLTEIFLYLIGRRGDYSLYLSRYMSLPKSLVQKKCVQWDIIIELFWRTRLFVAAGTRTLVEDSEIGLHLTRKIVQNTHYEFCEIIGLR